MVGAQVIFWRYTAPICYGIWSRIWFMMLYGTFNLPEQYFLLRRKGHFVLFVNYTKPYCDFGVFVILCCSNQNTYIDSRLNLQTVKTQVCHCCSFRCCASQKLTLCACQWKLKVTGISGLYLELWLQRASFLRKISSPNVRLERRSSRFSAYCLQSSTACRCSLFAMGTDRLWMIGSYFSNVRFIYLQKKTFLICKSGFFDTAIWWVLHQLIILVEISPSFQYHSSRMDERDISLKLPGTNLAPNALGTVS